MPIGVNALSSTLKLQAQQNTAKTEKYDAGSALYKANGLKMNLASDAAGRTATPIEDKLAVLNQHISHIQQLVTNKGGDESEAIAANIRHDLAIPDRNSKAGKAVLELVAIVKTMVQHENESVSWMHNENRMDPIALLMDEKKLASYFRGSGGASPVTVVPHERAAGLAMPLSANAIKAKQQALARTRAHHEDGNKVKAAPDFSINGNETNEVKPNNAEQGPKTSFLKSLFNKAIAKKNSTNSV